MTQADPIARFQESYERAMQSEPFDASRAALATADSQGCPSVRFVLVKGADARGFCVYTNLGSRKAQEMRANPVAALSFHWASTGEQVRVEGTVEPLSEAEADAYFETRPRGSQIGAWASQQSQPIGSRRELEDRVQELERRFQAQPVTRPPFWGGFRIVPKQIEFWHDRPDRLHDRHLYTRTNGAWTVTLLSP